MAIKHVDTVRGGKRTILSVGGRNRDVKPVKHIDVGPRGGKRTILSVRGGGGGRNRDGQGRFS